MNKVSLYLSRVFISFAIMCAMVATLNFLSWAIGGAAMLFCLIGGFVMNVDVFWKKEKVDASL